MGGAVGELRCELIKDKGELKENRKPDQKENKYLMWPVSRGTQELMEDEKTEEKHRHMQNVTIYHSLSLL